jgi:hypothetical protein
MRNTVILPIVSIVSVLLACGFAIERYGSMGEARAASTTAMEQVSKAQEMAWEHPEAYGVNANQGAKTDLKRMVQEAGARNGVSLLYLSETERDAGDSVRERNVMSRLVNVPHAKLVAFLADLESKGGGARIKEIRIKPALDRSDVYQEAEAILAIRWLTPKESGKVKTQ